MSALTDLFTALATKIRSKTGGSDTYTPPQMVNAIDDVYQAGVDAGETTHTRTYTPAANTAANDMGVTHDYRYVNTSGMIVPSGAKSITANGTGIDVSSYATANVNVPNPTLSGDATAADVKSGKTFYGSSYTKQTGTYVEPTIHSITPQNDSSPSLTSGSVYQPSTDGYAIKSFKNVTPRNSSPYSVQIGDMAHIETNDGYVVATEPIAITPLDTSPTPIETNKLYMPNNNGYAISSYPTSVTPSSSGTYFSSGMKKMASSGYAYSSQPQMKETTLWTNSSPTSNFAAQTITLLQDIDNFDYLKITYRLGASASTELSFIISVQDFKNTADTNWTGVITLNSKSSNVIYARLIYYASDTSVSVTVAYKIGLSGNSQAYSIPTKISGLKL